MKTHLPLVILACLSLQLTAQVKNTYSFAQGDTTQVTISWDAWAISGDPVLGCNIYRIENPDVPLNSTLITSTDSTYMFVDNSTFDPYFPPRYIIRAVRSSDTLEVSFAHAFSQIIFSTSGAGTLQMELVMWNPGMCCIGVLINVDDMMTGSMEYYDPFIMTLPPEWLFYIIYGEYDSSEMWFLTEFGFYAKIKLTRDFIAYLLTTVGVPEMPEAVYRVNIFPNPAKNHITFLLENTEHLRNIELRCFNLLGVQQHQTKILRGQQQATINVSAWPPGMYVAVVYSDGQPVGRGKFVVQR